MVNPKRTMRRQCGANQNRIDRNRRMEGVIGRAKLTPKRLTENDHEYEDQICIS